MRILRQLATATILAVILTGCSGFGGRSKSYNVDPQTSPETIASCKALDISPEVFGLMGQTTLIPRLNEADNIMCAFAIEGTGERIFPDLLLVTVEYDGVETYNVLYPDVRPDGVDWGQSDLGENAKWWSKDPKTQGEYGNGLGILAGTTFIQISTSFQEESPVLAQPQKKYEELGKKMLDGTAVQVDPRL